jgi:hypothetical protein
VKFISSSENNITFVSSCQVLIVAILLLKYISHIGSEISNFKEFSPIGQTANLTTNAFPDRSFKGTVLRIASEAEFTPGNVQSKEDRSRLVYAVTIQLKNSDGELKPGMIGDLTFP